MGLLTNAHDWLVQKGYNPTDGYAIYPPAPGWSGVGLDYEVGKISEAGADYLHEIPESRAECIQEEQRWAQVWKAEAAAKMESIAAIDVNATIAALPRLAASQSGKYLQWVACDEATVGTPRVDVRDANTPHARIIIQIPVECGGRKTTLIWNSEYPEEIKSSS